MSIAIAAIAIDTVNRGYFTGGMSEPDPELERLLAALDDLETAARDNMERSRRLQQRAHSLRSRLRAGEDLAQLVEVEERPRMVEMISTNMATLETAGAEFRAAEALALRSRGLTIEAIAVLFGVTRQRISALLKQKAAIGD